MKAEELLAWADKLPVWQSDALRRLWTQDVCSSTDLDEVLILLKSEHECTPADVALPAPIRLQRDHVAISSIASNRTCLQAMYEVKGVNALSANQRIEFGETGLTVIYGENASGKSGYSRVLKSACRARGVAEPIHPNVYLPGPYTPPEATFDLMVNGKPVNAVSWSQDKHRPEQLAEIAVFDTKCARVFVNDANEVEYRPYGLDVFTKLVDLCTTLKARLQAELKSLPKVPITIERFIGEGRVFASLTATTDPKMIREKARFDGKDQEALLVSTNALLDLAANDPKKRADAALRTKSRIDRIRESILRLKTALSSKELRRLKSLLDGKNTAVAAFELAKNSAFLSEPLSGTGNAVWRVMFDAARHFSEKHAYPDRQFPVTDDTSLCPLCQQPLQPDGQDRLVRFWSFVKTDTSRISAERVQLVKLEQDRLSKMITEPGPDNDVLAELEEMEQGVSVLVTDFFGSAKQQLRLLQGSLQSSTWTTPNSIDLNPSIRLSALSRRCLAQHSKYSKMDEPKERAELESRKAALELSKALHENLDSILSYVKQLKLAQSLNECHKAADTTQITRKQSEFMKQSLTDELRKALKRELDALHVENIEIDLEPSGSLGKTRHKLALPAQTYQNAGLADIFSEGEHRVIAIAAFLAELSVSPHNSAIVFDDPVSSLDHHWRESVASRLTSEGGKRQVVIFTHDIAFLMLLLHEATQQQIPIKTETLTRANEMIGICDPQLPWPALGVKEQIGYLRRRAVDIAKTRKGTDAVLLDQAICYFYGRLRDAWERAIEEVLLGNVIQRFRRETETQRLSVVSVTNSDYSTVWTAMKRCSGLMAGHSQPIGGSFTQPADSVIEKDINELDEYVKSINERNKAIAEERKALVPSGKPPKSQPPSTTTVLPNSG